MNTGSGQQVHNKTTQKRKREKKKTVCKFKMNLSLCTPSHLSTDPEER